MANGTVRVSGRPSDGRRYIRPSKIKRMYRSLSLSFGFVPFNLHPRSTLRAVARRHGGGCCAVRYRCGGMALSTWSTLRASARSGGGQVLGRCLPLHPHDRHPSYEQVLIGMGWVSRCSVSLWHPRSTLQAEARRHGAGAGRGGSSGLVGVWEGAFSVTWRVYQGGGTYLAGIPYTTPALVHRSHRSPQFPLHATFHSSFIVWMGIGSS
jgi:hypothetical protein